MADDRADIHEVDTEADDPRLEAGLRAGFTPLVAVASEKGLSVLAELEGRLGSETRVHLRDEGGDGTSWAVAVGSTRYEELGEIARGGMGIIVRSRDNDLGRDVAMKVLRPRHADNAAMVRRFVEEAQIAGQLQHPGILQVYELGLQPDKRPYFTMKLIKGRTLSELLEQRGSLAEERRRYLDVFERVCQAMAYTHARGVLHRDLKPANVMVGNFGEVQIVDWGLAKVISRDGADHGESKPTSGRETVIQIPGSDSGSQSVVGSVMGTPAYMPPEQARGDVDKLDERSDVFALGAILCEILTGKAPYVGDSASILEDAKDAHLAGAFARLSTCDADEELVDLAIKCLARRRDDRPDNAASVADAMSAYLASIEERARASELAAAEARAKAAEERRARRLTIALAGSILMVIVVVGGSFFLAQERRLERITAASQQANRQLAEATRLLAEAKDTPVGDQKAWIALRAAGANVAALHGAAELDEETRDRTSAFLDEFDQANRDRRLIETIEDVVINRATHDDQVSWVLMERELREAFADYGIDLAAMTYDEIVQGISGSDLSRQIADGLEMWLATHARLSGELGGGGLTMDELEEWMTVVYRADPDPYRVRVRELSWTPEPDPDALRQLAAAPEAETAPARTLSWLAFSLGRIGDTTAADDVYRRALHRFPTDFMLNFDYGLLLVWQERWEEAIRYYHRALAIRPAVDGAWRSLAQALLETGDLDGALDAVEQAVAYRGDFAPTHVDLGLVRAAAGDLEGAVEAYERALSLRPDYEKARTQLAECRRQLENQAPVLRETPAPPEPVDMDNDPDSGKGST